MQLDIEQLTLNEVEALEEASGTSIDRIMESGSPKGRVLKALIWVMKRRSDPSITLEEAGNTPLSEVMVMFGDEDNQGN